MADDTTTRFALIELDNATPAPAPVAKPPAATVSNDGGWSRGVSDAAANLVERERELAKRHGFEHDDGALAYVAGTQLADVGLATAAAYAKEYEALPLVAEAAIAHTETINAEQRKDRVVQLADWRLDLEGKLRPLVNGALDTKVGAALSDTAWGQLGQRQTTIKGPEADLVRGNVNAWIGKVPGNACARVRTHKGGREIFGLVSAGKRGYTAYDGDAVLRDIAKVLPDTKADVKYDADTTRLRVRALIQAPIEIPAFIGVGRVHQVGLEITTRDDGTASISGRAFIVRIRCKNHTLTQENTNSIRQRHLGNLETLRAQLTTLTNGIPELIEDFRALWARAAAEHYVDSETGLNLSACEAIERLVRMGHVPTGGLSKEAAIDGYQAAWRAEESPNSAMGVVMAVQRAAHEVGWKTKWSDEEIEESASNLLYNKVYALEAPVYAAS